MYIRYDSNTNLINDVVSNQALFHSPGGVMNAGVDLTQHSLHTLFFILIDNFYPHIEAGPYIVAGITEWKGIQH